MSKRVTVAKLATIVLLASMTSFGVSQTEAQEIEQDNWSGFSVSVGAGAQNIDQNLNTDLFRDDFGQRLRGPIGAPRIIAGISRKTGDAFFSDDEWKAFGTAQIAFDQKLGNFVIGAFADFDFGSDANTSYTVTGLDTNSCIDTSRPGRNCPILPGGNNSNIGNVEVDYGSMWSIGGRLGYLASPNWLIYGLAAYSEMNVDVSASMIDPFPRNGRFLGDQPTNVSFNIDKLTGLTLGGGTEFAIAKNLHFKLEYRYTDFSGEGASYSNQTTVTRGRARQDITERLSVNLDSEVHSVRAAIVLKLGTP